MAFTDHVLSVSFQVSKTLVEMQIDNNKLREEMEAAKFELTNKVPGVLHYPKPVSLTSSILSLSFSSSESKFQVNYS